MAKKQNLVIDQGATFSVDFSFNDANGDGFNLQNHVANSQIRKWYTSSNPSAVFNATINVDSSSVTLSLSANQTSNLVAGRYVYDIEINNGISTTRLVEGIVTVNPQVTR